MLFWTCYVFQISLVCSLRYVWKKSHSSETEVPSYFLELLITCVSYKYGNFAFLVREIIFTMVTPEI